MNATELTLNCHCNVNGSEVTQTGYLADDMKT